MTIIVPLAVIVLLVVVVIDDLLGWLWQGGSTSSYDMVGLMKKGGGRRGWRE